MKTLHLYSFITAGILSAITAQAQSVVVPGNFANTEGDSANVLPFDLGNFAVSAERYQQVYDSTLFSSLPAGGVLISGMAFRIAPGWNSFSTTLPDVQIDLSTTTFNEGNLSTTFASNVGANDTVVHPAGPLALSGTVSGSLNPFNVIINFTTPFLYNPASGNLLLDVHNFGGGTTAAFDASEFSAGIGRALTVDSGVNSPIADDTDTSGLVTEFIYQPVPEPGTLALAGLGGLTLLSQFRRRK